MSFIVIVYNVLYSMLCPVNLGNLPHPCVIVVPYMYHLPYQSLKGVICILTVLIHWGTLLQNQQINKKERQQDVLDAPDIGVLEFDQATNIGSSVWWQMEGAPVTVVRGRNSKLQLLI